MINLSKNHLKRVISSALVCTMTATMLQCFPDNRFLVNAEETNQKYPYTMFAASSNEGAITVNANNFCVNGNVATNGTIVSSGNTNINGTRTEQAAEEMLYIFDKIDSKYFTGSNVEEYTEDYTLEEMNININNPVEVEGDATLTGNININSALKALENVELYGEVKNTNDSLIFSKYGDIIIESQNVNLNGLVYAPFGDVVVTAQNLNLNNVVIIADTITFECPSVNANYSNSVAEFAGSVSDPLNIPYEEWQYMKDGNENGLPDFFEDFDNWLLLKDTDGDKLPDSIEQYLGSDSILVDTDGDLLDDYYEVFITGTDSTLIDTDENGITDGDEDFDNDGLKNYEEHVQSTSPWSEDSDSDSLTDGEEVNRYGTNPLRLDTDFDALEDGDEIYLGTDPTLQDTDGDGIFDCEERFNQTFTHIVENEDCAIEEVIVSMEGTGNLQTNTTIESVMGKDVICSEVAGLVGEPFSIETTSQFDTATLTFKIDQSKLGDTAFDNLMFLWYDEENYEFVELETFYDYENSIVSIETTHFSRYMIVDKSLWFEAWSVEFNYRPTDDGYNYNYTYDTVIAIDCSGSMSSYDTVGTNSKRGQAASNFFATMRDGDRAGVVAFTSSAAVTCALTDSQTDLTNSLSYIRSNGGTSFSTALSTALTVFDTNNTLPIKKRIILLSDGEDSVPYVALDKCKERNIVVYTIGLGSSSDSVLETIATYTGGEFFKAYTADELLDIYSNIGISSDFDTTDTDEDGLYDAVEAAGIRLQNGKIINTDPTNPDSDNDGILDGDEINPTPIYSEKEDNGWLGLKKLLGINKVQGYYFEMNSNPRKEDSDGDNILDAKDIQSKIKNNYTTDIINYINSDILNMNTIETTNDDFIIIKTPISEMLNNAGVDTLYDSDGYSYVVDGYYDDWYIFSVNNSTPTYGLYKMREQEYDTDDNNDPGITISFISLDISKFNDVLNDEKESTEDLCNEIDKVVRVPDATYSDVIQEYFADVESEGAYLIAEAYVNKIAKLSNDNKIAFPDNLTNLYNEIDDIDELIESLTGSLFGPDPYTLAQLYKEKQQKSRVPNALKTINDDSENVIVDISNRQIIVSNVTKLSLYEKKAILSAFTADVSFNMFAAEVQAHAIFVVDWKSCFDKWYSSAIRADMAIGEEYESGMYDDYYDPESDWVQNQIAKHGEY